MILGQLYPLPIIIIFIKLIGEGGGVSSSAMPARVTLPLHKWDC